jgi:tetratricopeptide (TPR) repeat protein
MRVHELTVQGRNSEAVQLADRLQGLVEILGDERSVAMINQGRMYAQISLGRLQEALVSGERLLQRHRDRGYRASEARALADIAEVLIKLGRLDEGLHRLANAIRVLDHVSPPCPRSARPPAPPSGTSWPTPRPPTR